MNYKDIIDTIDKKVVDLTAASDLFTIDEFISVYESSSVYKEDALLFVSDTTNNTQKRQIAVYSMQNLSDSLYIDFCSSFVDLFVKGFVTEELLQTTIFYSLNKKYQIIKNYRNATVISLLNKIKLHSQHDDLIRRIDDVLTGKTWNKLADFLEDGN